MSHEKEHYISRRKFVSRIAAGGTLIAFGAGDAVYNFRHDSRVKEDATKEFTRHPSPESAKEAELTIKRGAEWRLSHWDEYNRAFQIRDRLVSAITKYRNRVAEKTTSRGRWIFDAVTGAAGAGLVGRSIYSRAAGQRRNKMNANT